MRKVSKIYGVKGYKGKGSEYFLLDVRHGASRVEVNGTSLVNHANADSIVKLLFEMEKASISANEVTILTYYQSQRRLLRQKINETT